MQLKIKSDNKYTVLYKLEYTINVKSEISFGPYIHELCNQRFWQDESNGFSIQTVTQANRCSTTLKTSSKFNEKKVRKLILVNMCLCRTTECTLYKYLPYKLINFCSRWLSFCFHFDILTFSRKATRIGSLRRVKICLSWQLQSWPLSRSTHRLRPHAVVYNLNSFRLTTTHTIRELYRRNFSMSQRRTMAWHTLLSELRKCTRVAN